MKKNCLFCQIIAGEIPCYKIYEDDNWLAFLDINPVNSGHTLLVPKVHSLNLLEMRTKELASLGSIAQKIALAVKKGVKANGINLIINNGKEAGQLVDHSHLHIIPRFTGDGLKNWSRENSSLQPRDFEQTRGEIISQL